MIKRVFMGAIALSVVGASIPLIARARDDRKLDEEFQDQLRLARKEGIPTTVEEFVATIPKAQPHENAAPLYKKIDFRQVGGSSNIDLVDSHLTWNLTAEAKEAARVQLAKCKDALAIVDAAVKLPKCVFDRDYSQGVAVLFPEYSTLKGVARCVLLRGALSATEGDHAAALQDAKAVLTMSAHLYDEPILIGSLVSDSYENLALNALANFAMRYREVPEYRKLLVAALGARKPRSAKSLHRNDLVEILTTIEFSETKEGRERIGIRETDREPMMEMLSKLQSPKKGRILIVKGIRARWAALDAPRANRTELLLLAEHTMYKGLMSFPTAAGVFEGLGAGLESEPPVPDYESRFAARRLGYKAFLRALEKPTVPRTIKTDDLLSPFDQKPVTYKYENGQVLIEVSQGSDSERPIRLRIGKTKEPLPKVESKISHRTGVSVASIRLGHPCIAFPK